MEKDIQLSKELELKMELKDGKIQLSAVYSGDQAGAQMGVTLDPALFIDHLAALIPGKVDDALFEVLKAALKAA